MHNRKHIPVLDGIRFFAAFFVVVTHYTYWVLADQGYHDRFADITGSLSGLGMALFFVLSGFVIHYNYSKTVPSLGGKRLFLIARFTRLYPLYITIFLIEFASSLYVGRGACGLAGDRWGDFLALPYHLTLTQDWTYGMICNRSLIYQYHMVSGVSWSLSLEIFFYLSYPFFVNWLNRQSSFAKQIIYACLAQAAVVAYFLLCFAYSHAIENIAFTAFGKAATIDAGYESSFIRWLYYFNPIMNLAAFFIGTIVANLYLHVKDKPISKRSQIWGSALTLTSIVATIAVNFWFYLDIAKTNSFIGRTASSLYVPLVAMVIYCLARYPNCLWSRMIANPLFVKLGQASYSIYLLHAFFGWNARDFYHLKLNPWLLYAIAISAVLAISRMSYLFFERPAMIWLRKKME